mgnify:CR=1 FL=1
MREELELLHGHKMYWVLDQKIKVYFREIYELKKIILQIYKVINKKFVD